MSAVKNIWMQPSIQPAFQVRKTLHFSYNSKEIRFSGVRDFIVRGSSIWMKFEVWVLWESKCRLKPLATR